MDEGCNCVDGDGDGHGSGCLAGPDCNDADPNNWDSCSTCFDRDGDFYYDGCDAYVTVPGPDCDDLDPCNWVSCSSCLDFDWDGVSGGPCDACMASGDCNDSDPSIYPGAPELCDGYDNQCPGDPGYGMVDEGCPGSDIPIDFDGYFSLTINGDISYQDYFDGHLVEIRVGDTNGNSCAFVGDGSDCWVRLINRDPDYYMANAFIMTSGCDGCIGSEIFANADFEHGSTVHGPGEDGNAGAPAALSDAGFCYVEDGQYKTAPYPYNQYGCGVHDLPAAQKKPFQMLHPSSGQRTALWSLRNTTSPIRFYATITADYFPINPGIDPRSDLQNKATFYVMAANLSDNTGIGATLNGRTWLRPGAYRRSQVISGYGMTASNVLAPGRYFAVNVAVEYPDRMEAQEVANTFGNHNYEYYREYDYILHYNPSVVQLVVGKAGSRVTPGGTQIYQGVSAPGALDDKDCFVHSITNYCGNPGLQTFEGLSAILNASGNGWIALDVSLDNGSGGPTFAAHQTGSYKTFYGGVGHLNLGGFYYYSYPSYPVAPKMNAHYGRAHLNIPMGGARTWFPSSNLSYNIPSHSWIVKQEGIDPDPDQPLAMYYFWIPTGAPSRSGKGSEFWIDMFAGYASLMVAWTNGTIYPGGAYSLDDWSSICLPFQAGFENGVNQGCDIARPIPDYWVYQGHETVNDNIGQSGAAVIGGIPGYGAVQQWSASVIVQ